jgi:uncharacterized protein with ParB-like and HNH nuclease domain
MDVHDEKFGNLIYTRRQYLVPIWQREYSWGIQQWSELWNDIMRLYAEIFEKGNGQDTNHFMGSVVLKPKELGGVEKYVLIDGQQRISTLIVILALLRDSTKEQNPTLSNTIQTSYLLNRDIKSVDEQFKLHPSVTDNPPFEKMMNGETDLNGRFGQAYNFYKQLLDEEREKDPKGCDLEKLKEIIIDNLRLVEIILSEKDDSNRIFETLNSRGLDLEPADLLRNFFMMKMGKESEAENLYTTTWFPMQESLVNAENLTEFFRHYLAMENQTPVKQEDIYGLIEEKLKWSSEDEVISELKKAKDYSKYYQRLLFPIKEPNLALRRRIERLNMWKVSTAYPLLLKAYLEKIPEGDMCKVMEIIESFIVRRHFCNVKTNSLNTIFTALCNLGGKDIASSIEKKLASFGWNYKWPGDEEFSKAFLTLPIYKSSYSKCLLVLSSLEQSFEHPEKVELSGLTIEHVMPETITDWWKKHLGPEWQRVHSELKDTVGNLTFVAGPINPSLSNQPFPEKKKWFMKTKVELSRYFQSLENWTRTDITERAEVLSNKAIQIWKHPK